MSKIRKKRRFYLLSLGCSKNSVDSEGMAALLNRAGYGGEADPAEAGILLVNTCGFIESARRESVKALTELARIKADDQLLIAAGCLSQRLGPALIEEVPGLDGVIGTRRWMDLIPFIRKLRRQKRPAPLYHLPTEAQTVGSDERNVLRAAINGSSAYLKISDGCRRPCAFCAIPQIKGTLVSRPREKILKEVKHLQSIGVKEIVLIAQDTTDYGHDLGIKNGLAHLLEDIVEAAPDIPWIRIMYAYPGYVTDELIEVMARHEQVLPYLDIPLQHGHRETLKRMRRPANVEWVYRTIDKLRKAMPEIAIRTTMIVGYPGESDAEFEALLDFVEEIQFDRVGSFTYSYESSTPSAKVSWQVDEDVKEERRAKLMTLQQKISLARNQEQVGRTLPVLIEGSGDSISIGRTYRDAPEVDGLVVVDGELAVGDFTQVRIEGALEYDLTGTPVLQTEGRISSPDRMPLNEVSVTGP